jgi:hypothetical protein
MEVFMIVLFRKQLIVAVLFALLLIPGLSFADVVGSFTKVEGNVDILRPNATLVIPVHTGDPVSLGDAIRTKRNGKAEIQFRDESVVQLAPETRIVIDQYSFSAGNTRAKGILGLFRGKMRAIVSKIRTGIMPVSFGDSSFNIKTPTAVAGVKGTDFIVYYQRNVTGIVFLDGNGFVVNPRRPDRVVPIRAGQATFVPSGSAPPPAATTVSRSFIAPHLRDTTASPVSDTTSNQGTGGGTASTANNASSNTSANTQGTGGGTSPAANNTPSNTTVDSQGNTGGNATTTNIVSSNTTYDSLANTTMSSGPQTGSTLPGAPQAGNTSTSTGISNPINTAGVSGNTIVTPPPPPPITVTNTQLLTTPVKVNVHVP